MWLFLSGQDMVNGLYCTEEVADFQLLSLGQLLNCSLDLTDVNELVHT